MLKKLLISKKEYIILFFITIIICLPLLISSQYTENIDTSSINALYTRMCNGGTCFDKILPIIDNDFGYGLGNFLPQLSNITSAGLAYLLHGNIMLAVKIIHFILYFIAAIMMFKLTKKLLKNKSIAIITSTIYITLPYIITNMIRNYNISEIFSLALMPIVFVGLYELFYGSKRKFFLWFVVGYLGLINSNIMITIYFTILVVIYLIMNIKKVFKLERFASLFGATVLTILLTLPFTSALLDHCFLDEYYIFKNLDIVNIYNVIQKLEIILTFVISVLISRILTKKYIKKNRLTYATILMAVLVTAIIYGNIETNNMENMSAIDKFEISCLPSRTVENMEYLENRGNDIIVRRGKANIEVLNNKNPDLEFRVLDNSYSVILELPRIYYLGYHITFTNENNEVQELKFYINENGFVETRALGNGIVKVEYKQTAFEYVANRITLVTLIIILISFAIYKVKYKSFKTKHIGKVKLLSGGTNK